MVVSIITFLINLFHPHDPTFVQVIINSVNSVAHLCLPHCGRGIINSMYGIFYPFCAICHVQCSVDYTVIVIQHNTLSK